MCTVLSYIDPVLGPETLGLIRDSRGAGPAPNPPQLLSGSLSFAEHEMKRSNRPVGPAAGEGGCLSAATLSPSLSFAFQETKGEGCKRVGHPFFLHAFAICYVSSPKTFLLIAAVSAYAPAQTLDIKGGCLDVAYNSYFGKTDVPGVETVPHFRALFRMSNSLCRYRIWYGRLGYEDTGGTIGGSPAPVVKVN
eukprot:181736-Rhodomonas_salina.2